MLYNHTPASNPRLSNSQFQGQRALVIYSSPAEYRKSSDVIVCVERERKGPHGEEEKRATFLWCPQWPAVRVYTILSLFTARLILCAVATSRACSTNAFIRRLLLRCLSILASLNVWNIRGDARVYSFRFNHVFNCSWKREREGQSFSVLVLTPRCARL